MIPICPTQTFTYVLVADRKLPRSATARFSLRALTRQQVAEIRTILNLDVADDMTNKQWSDAVYSSAATVLAGWCNVGGVDGQPLKFSSENVPNALTLSEAWELVQYALGMAEPTEDDRKNSDSPSHTNTAACATGA